MLTLVQSSRVMFIFTVVWCHFDGSLIDEDVEVDYGRVVPYAGIVKSYLRSCTACLVKPNWALTSSTCIYGVHPNNVTVYFGVNHYSDDHAITVRVTQLFLHPNYEFNSIENDIGLIYFNIAITISNRIKIIPLVLYKWLAKPFKKCKSTGLTEDNVLMNIDALAAKGGKQCSCLATERFICVAEVQVNNKCLTDTGGPLVCGNHIYGLRVTRYNRAYCDSEEKNFDHKSGKFKAKNNIITTIGEFTANITKKYAIQNITEIPYNNYIFTTPKKVLIKNNYLETTSGADKEVEILNITHNINEIEISTISIETEIQTKDIIENSTITASTEIVNQLTIDKEIENSRKLMKVTTENTIDNLNFNENSTNSVKAISENRKLSSLNDGENFKIVGKVLNKTEDDVEESEDYDWETDDVEVDDNLRILRKVATEKENENENSRLEKLTTEVVSESSDDIFNENINSTNSVKIISEKRKLSTLNEGENFKILGKALNKTEDDEEESEDYDWETDDVEVYENLRKLRKVATEKENINENSKLVKLTTELISESSGIIFNENGNSTRSIIEISTENEVVSENIAENSKNIIGNISIEDFNEYKKENDKDGQTKYMKNFAVLSANNFEVLMKESEDFDWETDDVEVYDNLRILRKVVTENENENENSKLVKLTTEVVSESSDDFFNENENSTKSKLVTEESIGKRMKEKRKKAKAAMKQKQCAERYPTVVYTYIHDHASWLFSVIESHYQPTKSRKLKINWRRNEKFPIEIPYTGDEPKTTDPVYRSAQSSLNFIPTLYILQTIVFILKIL